MSIPRSTLGRAAAVLFLVSIVAMVLMGTVMESSASTIGPVNAPGAVTFAFFLATAVTGALALIRARERSWIVWLATVLTGTIIVFEVVSWAVPD